AMDELPGDSVFGINHNKITRAKRQLQKRLPPDMEQWGLHDLRTAMRTNMSAIPSISQDVAELCIAHAPPSLVQHYDLHSYRAEKLAALTAWERRLHGFINPPAGNVAELRRAS